VYRDLESRRPLLESMVRTTPDRAAILTCLTTQIRPRDPAVL
jgi:hypothetical protein